MKFLEKVDRLVGKEVRVNALIAIATLLFIVVLGSILYLLDYWL